MPYQKPKYKHHRRRNPKEFIKSSLRTVPVSHVKTRKRWKKGSKAIVGKLKKTGKWATQSILELK